MKKTLQYFNTKRGEKIKMLKKPTFYSVIIGTELLNGRREDGHFSFLNRNLIARGWEHKANFIIKDDVTLLEEVYSLIQKDPNSVMFSFGGIGSTPDDFTREIAAKAFTNKPLERHNEAEKIIIDTLGKRAFPHPVKMADLPHGANLITNPVNKMPGFQLEDRFFFVPGFVQMSHPMVITVLDQFFSKNIEKYSCNFVVDSSEAVLIDIMESLPKELELSCLPAFIKDKKSAEIYLAHEDKDFLEQWCTFFKQELHKMELPYKNV